MIKPASTHSFLILLVAALSVTSCRKEVDGDCPKCPTVIALRPDAAYFGDTVLITGRYLLPNPDYGDILEVKVNSILIPDVNILESYADSIRLIVPHDIESGTVTVDLNVEDGLVSRSSVNFTYLWTSDVKTYAGSGDEGNINVSNQNPLDAKFDFPRLLVFDPAKKSLFVVERNFTNNSNTIIREIDSLGNTSTLLNTSSYISAIGCDHGGQKYVAIGTNNVACQISKLSNAGTLTNWVTNGCGQTDSVALTSAKFQDIRFLAFDVLNNVYVAESNRIRKIDLGSGFVSTLAGSVTKGYADGLASDALFSQPNSLAIENDGTIYVSDNGNNVIRKIKGGTVSTVAGIAGKAGFSNAATALASLLSNPRTVVSDHSGTVYLLESVHCIRQLVPSANTIKTFAGHYQYPDFLDGRLLEARFNNPRSLAYDPVSKILFIADCVNHRIRSISFD